MLAHGSVALSDFRLPECAEATRSLRRGVSSLDDAARLTVHRTVLLADSDGITRERQSPWGFKNRDTARMDR